MAPRRAAFSLLPPSRRGRGVTPPIREWESGRWDRGRPAEGAGGGSPLLCRDRRLVPWRILVAHIHPFRHTAQSCCPRPSLSSPGCIPGRKCVQAPRRLSTDSGGRSAPPFQLQREREREREKMPALVRKRARLLEQQAFYQLTSIYWNSLPRDLLGRIYPVVN